MFIKIMAGDGIADSNCDKEYELIEALSCKFQLKDHGYIVPDFDPQVVYVDMLGNTHTVRCPGNVYLLNAQGKTVETWAPHSGSASSNARQLTETRDQPISQEESNARDVEREALAKTFTSYAGKGCGINKF